MLAPNLNRQFRLVKKPSIRNLPCTCQVFMGWKSPFWSDVQVSGPRPCFRHRFRSGEIIPQALLPSGTAPEDLSKVANASI